MKVAIVLVVLVILVLNDLFAEVRNGYEKDILAFRRSLQSLQEMLQTNQCLQR